ncbi:MAG: peptide ABC transporter permease [Rhizobiales bacterium]|nr:peptide ABC transporter permease [Hyphomicrobiales bacterium]
MPSLWKHSVGSRQARESKQQRTPYPADKARGGEIILRTPLRRMIFFGGLIGAIVLVLVLRLLSLLG